MTEQLDVVIPGAQKAGTSTLLSVLGRHSGIDRHPMAEMGALLEGGPALELAVSREYPKSGDGLRIAKSAGLMHDERAMREIVRLYPDIRFLVMLREPVARTVSAFRFAKRTGDERSESLREALDRGSGRADVSPDRRRWVQYLERSEYLGPLRTMRSLVGESRMHIILLEEYRDRPEETIEAIEDWLDLQHERILQGGPSKVNSAATARSPWLARALRYSGPATRAAQKILPRDLARSARRRLLALNEKEAPVNDLPEPELMEQLRSHFEVHNAALSKEFKMDLSAWSNAGNGKN